MYFKINLIRSNNKNTIEIMLRLFNFELKIYIINSNIITVGL